MEERGDTNSSTRRELAPLSDQPQGELLANAIESEAYSLIGRFEGVLKADKQFCKEAVDHFFGRLDYGYLIDPAHRYSVGFWHGQTPWEAGFDFTKDEQTLSLNVTTPVGLEYKEIRVILTSKRQESGHAATPLILVIGIAPDSGREAVIHRNNQQAIDVINKLLIFFEKE